ncbi:MAG: mechanosensitive ion channel [Gammaproteobacteria bacterium]|nr:mechanosensitive ion channel [Gammaproteobacteria bacterium]
MLDTLTAVWNYPLFGIGGESFLVSQIVLVAVVLLVGYAASKFIERLIKRRLADTDIRADASYALQRIVFYVLLVAVAMTALSLLHVPLTAFAFVSGAVAIGVGFGAQNIINNFISGWILLVERPVRINDFIEINEHQGVVERIGNRSTRIRRTDGVHLLIPNSQMLERVVVNWTLVDYQIRTIVRVGVAYGSPVRRVAELIEQAVREQPEVQDEPAPVIILDDFGDNAIVFDAYFWSEVGGERQLRQIRSAVRFRIDELFHENNIVIAFPQRDVHMNTVSPLEVRVVDTNETKGRKGK